MRVRQLRRAERLNCDIPVHVTVGHLRRPGRIIDVTPFGAQVSIAQPHAEGLDVDIEIRGQKIEAKVMWADGQRMGIRFAEQVVDGPLRKHIESLNASIYGNGMLPSMRRLEVEA